MPTELLTIGPIHTLVQDRIYALPARAVYFTCATVCELSNSTTFGTTGTTSTTAPTLVGAGFIRCTTAAPLATLKAT